MQSLISHSEAARNIVTNLLEAINREDFTTARTFLHNDMRYIGVFGSRDAADASLAEVQQRSRPFHDGLGRIESDFPMEPSDRRALSPRFVGNIQPSDY